MTFLEIHDIKKTYPTGEEALKGVDLAMSEQEVVALLGLSGSGKSTLLRCINRLVEPSAGKIMFDGVEITAIQDRRQLRNMRQRMGMIFQEFNLVNRLTVLENVLAGCLGYTPTWRCFLRAFRRDDIERAIQTCDRVGLVDHIRKRADQLSGGQRQRVGIARALMQRPKILLVDEPTSSLDPKIGREVMDLMSRLAAEEHIPMLVSVHDLGLAQAYTSRIIGLQGGVKVLDSKTSDVDADILENVYHIASAA
ncbi:MAG: phosphonate ABC transporter ATP-binding protein [Alphaproteobacteria bacterium]|nr:phosphonate ABC transporter ATP-binding protein [Alphaproteobacteria bacterium]